MKTPTGPLKLRELAEKLSIKIIEKRSPDRLTNTRRRLAIAASMHRDADRLEQLQKVMLSIATAIEDGTAVYLKKIKNRTQVETLIQESNRAKRLMDRKKPFYYYSEQNNSYRDTEARDLTMEEIIMYTTMPNFECGAYRINHFLDDLEKVLDFQDEGCREDYEKIKRYIEMQDRDYIDLSPVRKEMERLLSMGKKHRRTKYSAQSIHSLLMERKRLEAIGIFTDEDYRQCLIELLPHINGTKKSEEQVRVERIKMKEQEIAHRNIPGYFPTPDEVVEQMINEADIHSDMKVLEPSAGAGHIADCLVETGAQVDVIEINYSLRELLKEKGYNIVGQDFLVSQEKGKYDRIIMNPPFESGQDAIHIQHAYHLVKPGGKVVALASEGPFFRQDSQSKKFREFLTRHDGYSLKLPPNSFLNSDRSTGVNIRLVVLEKSETHVSDVAS
ncbi:class I SAM-dependent methyltransferase [Thermoactinomyces sp. DSM 45892]|uniref:methyltransferase n=1 Tax=Thermoactinomyces sp. DSM 45892 TaxID=1882753 RepID=UPI0008953E62|nr:class I SAM-dependent methyltransferase [Thermoactinomyces sp. DSM 45892]SDY89047.1 Methyltransferase small domain-containing protein [Thermoactinomyces sp. DSM 45892]